MSMIIVFWLLASPFAAVLIGSAIAFGGVYE